MGINNTALDGNVGAAVTVRGKYKVHTWPRSEIKSMLNSVSALILPERFTVSGVLGQEFEGVSGVQVKHMDGFTR